MEFLHSYANLDRTVRKQTVETLIRRRILPRLVWVCTVCLRTTKRMLGLYKLNTYNILGLRDGQLRRHEEVLDNAIYEAENSEFKDALKPSLDRCHALQYDISKLEMYCHPVLEMNHATISELANYNNPPQDVHSIMKAAYLLLGEEMNTLKVFFSIN